jgi:hypothetical protein
VVRLPDVTFRTHPLPARVPMTSMRPHTWFPAGKAVAITPVGADVRRHVSGRLYVTRGRGSGHAGSRIRLRTIPCRSGLDSNLQARVPTARKCPLCRELAPTTAPRPRSRGSGSGAHVRAARFRAARQPTQDAHSVGQKPLSDGWRMVVSTTVLSPRSDQTA